jgi:putative ABC transport system permease protein
VIVEGRPLPPEGAEPVAGYQMVSPGFFEAAGVPVVAGRDVAMTDTRDRPRIAVVNEAFAAQHWPGESAIGKRFRFDRDPGAPRIEVAGVVRNLRHNGPEAPPRAEFYLPYAQSSFSFMAVVVKAHGDPAALAEPVRQAVVLLDPEQPVSRVMTMAAHLQNDLAQPRFLSQLTLVFGGLALVLAAIGIYGVMAWSVTARTREFGVKLALGAQPGGLMRQILREGFAVVAIGALVGVAIAAGLSRLLASLLFETSPTEPGAYVTAAATVFVVALIAIAIPAQRAMRIDPIRSLRSE